MLYKRRSPESFRNTYNWFSRFYGLLEHQTIQVLRKVLSEHFTNSHNLKNKSIMEYGCGSGCLTIELAKRCATVHAKDISEGMLRRARRYANRTESKAEFSRGNLLNITEKDNSFDYVFLSFTLHVFSPADQELILSNLLKVAREKVVVIEHTRRWNPFIAVLEWLEGSYYDQFIKMDFSAIAQKIKAHRFHEVSCNLYTLLIFESGKTVHC